MTTNRETAEANREAAYAAADEVYEAAREAALVASLYGPNWNAARTIVHTSYNITELRLGRNIGTEPMTKKVWDRFKADAVSALEFFSQTVAADEFWTEVHTSLGGRYTDGDGVTTGEESSIVTLYWSGNGHTSLALMRLELDAAALAHRYKQDVVAVVHGGRSTLVKAKAVAR